MANGDIVIGYVHPGKVDEEWARSLAMAFANKDNQLVGMIGSTSARHEQARNNTIEQFLAGDAEWFMWIDTDQQFEDDAPAKLRAAAEADNVKMAGGITYIWNKAKKASHPQRMGMGRSRKGIQRHTP